METGHRVRQTIWFLKLIVLKWVGSRRNRGMPLIQIVPRKQMRQDMPCRLRPMCPRAFATGGFSSCVSWILCPRALLRLQFLEAGCRRRPALAELTPKQPDEPLQLGGGVRVLGEEVGWVLFSADLAQLKLLPSETLLEPKAVAINMT